MNLTMTIPLQDNVGSHGTKPFEVEDEINKTGEELVVTDTELFEIEKEVDNMVDDTVDDMVDDSVDDTDVEKLDVTDTEDVKTV